MSKMPPFLLTKIRVSRGARQAGFEDFYFESLKPGGEMNEQKKMMLDIWIQIATALDGYLAASPDDDTAISSANFSIKGKPIKLLILFFRAERAYFSVTENRPPIWQAFLCLENEESPQFISATSQQMKSATAEDFFDRGVFRYALDPRGALSDFIAAFNRDPNMIMAYIKAGDLLDDFGDYENAIEAFTRAINLDPNHAIAYYNRGVCYMSKEFYGNAIDDWSQALRIYPEMQEALANRGSIYNALGHFRLAIADLDQAIQLDPQDHRSIFTRAHVYQQLGNLRKAINDYSTYLKVGGGHVDGDYDKVAATIRELKARIDQPGYVETAIEPIYENDCRLALSESIRPGQFSKYQVRAITRAHHLHILQELKARNYIAEQLRNYIAETFIADSNLKPELWIVSKLVDISDDELIWDSILCLPNEAEMYKRLVQREK